RPCVAGSAQPRSRRTRAPPPPSVLRASMACSVSWPSAFLPDTQRAHGAVAQLHASHVDVGPVPVRTTVAALEPRAAIGDDRAVAKTEPDVGTGSGQVPDLTAELDAVAVLVVVLVVLASIGRPHGRWRPRRGRP